MAKFAPIEPTIARRFLGDLHVIESVTSYLSARVGLELSLSKSPPFPSHPQYIL